MSDRSADSDTEFVVLGKITGYFGVRGWVKVHSDTAPRENIVTYSQWWLGDAGDRKPIKVKGGKRSGKNVVAQLEGINTRELAAPVIGLQISVPRTDLPVLDGEEYYWTDLVGCAVTTLQGVAIGPVDRMFETGANDVMVVKDQRVVKDQHADLQAKPENQNGDILIPWIRPSVVVTVDLPGRHIVVDWDPDF